MKQACVGLMGGVGHHGVKTGSFPPPRSAACPQDFPRRREWISLELGVGGLGVSEAGVTTAQRATILPPAGEMWRTQVPASVERAEGLVRVGR